MGRKACGCRLDSYSYGSLFQKFISYVIFFYGISLVVLLCSPTPAIALHSSTCVHNSSTKLQYSTHIQHLVYGTSTAFLCSTSALALLPSNFSSQNSNTFFFQLFMKLTLSTLGTCLTLSNCLFLFYFLLNFHTLKALISTLTLKLSLFDF